ncbi:TonB-dependent receptor [Proteiniphilum sp.]|uniref:TonB-dependent receptor domain-containing protein n=1 Tax=Proteiniphilum sp. TaxID=1926877 RepID=UPI00332B1E55
MKATIIFLVLSFIPYWTSAQSIQKISGKVLSEDGSPTDGYNVILLSPQDSTLYKGDFFLDPDFFIETNRLPVLMKVTSFGFRDTLFLVSSNIEELAEIRLASQSYTLNEVVVKASLPMFSMKTDRITLNVEGTALSESGSAVDVLQKAARVRVEESGISVLGVGNAMIIVDGRELPASQSLGTLSSSEIRKVDIITNPSSKYDAKGKAVIEITTKKAKRDGFGAAVTSRMSKGTYWNPYMGTEISAKTDRVSFYGFYAYSTGKSLITESYVRDYTNEIPPLYGLVDMESINRTTGSHRIRLSGDYDLSDKHKVGLQLSDQFLDGNNKKEETSRTYSSADIHLPPVSELASLQEIPFKRNYQTATAYYSYQSSPTGMKLNAVLDRSRYDTKSNALIHETGNSTVITKQNDVKATIDIASFKTDASIPLPKGYRLETGVKYSNMHNRSNTLFSTGGGILRDIDYDYKENIGAFYFLLSNRFGKIDAELGARMEVSDNYATTDVVVQDTTQWNIFPSATLNWNIAKDWDVNFSYAMKISRPTFQDLNPAIDYVDSTTYFQGNPGLVPEIRHALTLKLSYLKMITLGVSYTRKNDLLAWYVEQDPMNPVLTRITQKNINKSDVLSVDAVLPYQNRWVSGYLSTGMIYTISNDRASQIANLKQPMWYAYSGFDFTLPYGFKVNANIRYFTKGLENVFYFDPVFRMDIGIRKSFSSDKLTAGIIWNDVFRTDDMTTYTTLNNRYIGYHYYYDRQLVNFSLTYRFSSQKSKYQSRSSINEESKRIKNL